jgi:GntR family transcriptional regulator
MPAHADVCPCVNHGFVDEELDFKTSLRHDVYMNQMETALPFYARVEAAMTQAITDGTWPPGKQLPTEEALMERFQVSRTTVRKAVQNLAGRGLVEIRRGRGTFVIEPRITQELTELSGFVEDMQAQGRTATARLVDKRVVQASREVARQLGLAMGSPVVRIERVRLADGVALSFDETYLPQSIGTRLMDDDLETEPIFELLEQKYSIALVQADYQLQSVLAPAAVAGFLGIAPNDPIFLIERTSYGAQRVPVDYEKLYYRGDLVRFRTTLARRPKRPLPK